MWPPEAHSHLGLHRGPANGIDSVISLTLPGGLGYTEVNISDKHSRDWRPNRVKLSTKGKYGVKALFELAMYEGTGPVSLKSIAERQGLSEHYLEQLAAPLRKSGLITSIRGAQGGYVLSRPATQITVGDVIRVLEGPIGFTDCATEGEPAPDCAADCAVHGVWEKVTQQIVSVIDSITLYDLVEQSRAEQARMTLNYQI